MSSVNSTNLSSDSLLGSSRTRDHAKLAGERGASKVWLGFRWAFLGNIVYAACQWAIVILLAQLGTPEMVGQFALALAIAGPVFFVSNLQLRAIQASDAGWEHQFPDYWCLRLIMAPVAIALITGFALLGNYTAEVATVIIVMGIAKAVESLSDICFGAIQRNDRLDLVGKSLCIKGPGTLLFMGLLVWSTQSVAIGLCGSMLAWLLMFGLFDFANVRREDRPTPRISSVAPRWNWHHQRRLIAIGLPMGLSMGLVSLTVGLPNILVERLLGEHQLGVFAALASLSWAGLPLVNAMGQAIMPRMGQLFVAHDRRGLRRVVYSAAGLGALLGTVGVFAVWLVGEWIVAHVYGDEYSLHNSVLIWLMIAASVLFAVRFLADALTAMRCVRVHLIAQALTAAVVFCGGILAVPPYGMVGMAQVLTLALLLRGAILLVCFWWRTEQFADLSCATSRSS